VNHLTHLWRRGGWLGFFFFMTISLILVIIFTASLDAVLAARSEINAEPFAGMGARRSRNVSKAKPASFLGNAKEKWETIMIWVKEGLEIWTAAKSDKQIAWTLGIGWACCGGGLAGGTLVFAKAM
jgi:magnesium transporter